MFFVLLESESESDTQKVKESKLESKSDVLGSDSTALLAFVQNHLIKKKNRLIDFQELTRSTNCLGDYIRGEILFYF